MGAVYNVVNAYLNATAIVHFSPPPGPEWLVRPAGLAGLVLFAAGYATNREADRRLRALREHEKGGYGVPRGGLYEHVSCPNYLGEIVEWCGWALLAGTAAGWSFAFFTACNLVPRALAHQRWYRRHFPDYPGAPRADPPAAVTRGGVAVELPVPAAEGEDRPVTPPRGAAARESACSPRSGMSCSMVRAPSLMALRSRSHSRTRLPTRRMASEGAHLDALSVEGGEEEEVRVLRARGRPARARG